MFSVREQRHCLVLVCEWIQSTSRGRMRMGLGLPTVLEVGSTLGGLSRKQDWWLVCHRASNLFSFTFLFEFLGYISNRFTLLIFRYLGIAPKAFTLVDYMTEVWVLVLPLLLFCLYDTVSLSCQGWVCTCNPLASVFHNLGITVAYLHTQLLRSLMLINNIPESKMMWPKDLQSWTKLYGTGF